MAILFNCCTSCNLYITAGAVGIACVAFLITCSFLLSYEICATSMISRIKVTISSAANGTNRLFLTSSSSTGMSSTIKLSATTTGMKVMGLVYLPITISIFVVSGSRNARTGCSLGITILTPSIAGIARFITGRSSSIAGLSILMIVGVQLAIGLFTLSTNSLILTSCFATSVLTGLIQSNEGDLSFCISILLSGRARVSFNSEALNYTVFSSANVVVTQSHFTDFSILTENSNLSQRSTVIESSLTDFLHSFRNHNTCDLSVLHKSFCSNCGNSVLNATNCVLGTNDDISCTTGVASDRHLISGKLIGEVRDRVGFRLANGHRAVVNFKANLLHILINDLILIVVIICFYFCHITLRGRLCNLKEQSDNRAGDCKVLFNSVICPAESVGALQLRLMDCFTKNTGI